MRERPIENKIAGKLDSQIVYNIEEDLRDIFRSTKDPVKILLEELKTEESRSKVPADISSAAISRLSQIEFKNENEFVDGVMAALGPVLEITMREKRAMKKLEGREMYERADIEAAANLIRENGKQKIYVVGNVGSGKTTFARELSREVGFKNIDIDKWYKSFRLEIGRVAKNLKEILDFIFKKEQPPFIINHADLLRQNLLGGADMVVYLNPKLEEQLKTRELRGKDDAEGEWKNVVTEKYEKIIKNNTAKFEDLGGKEEYNNRKSGTVIKFF